MAEFKISRLRYTWKGNWTTTTAYIKDDVVKYGGSSWVCVRQHTADVFATDQTFLANPNDTDFSPAWIKMTEGNAFRGDWQSATLYNPGDVIKYGGSLYLTVTSFTSTATFDDGLPYLSIYASATNWRNDWQPATRYGIGDTVRYGGLVYKCQTGHTSATTPEGLEEDIEKWSVHYSGVDFKGLYAEDVRYKLHDLVLYNGTILKCSEGYTSSTVFDATKWTIELPGTEFDNEWSATVYYGVGSVVRHGGDLYYGILPSYGKNPVDSIYQVGEGPYWEVLAKGTNFRGQWSSTVSYKTGDVVRRGGILYIAKLDTVSDGSSQDYLDTSNWEILNSSLNWTGPWESSRTYAVNDVVAFLGDTYKANQEHASNLENFPGDNGSGFAYWDLVVDSAGTGLRQIGDLLTYDLSRTLQGDGSTFGPTNVPIGIEGQLLSIDNNDGVIYRSYGGGTARVFYVAPNGVDDPDNPLRGHNKFLPWKTVRYAAERADDGFNGTTTIRVAAGEYYEILPIILPKGTVLQGAELRSTTIIAAPAIEALALDSTYTKASLNRISQIIQTLIAGTMLNPPKTSGNSLEPVVLTYTEERPFVPPQFDDFGNEILETVEFPIDTGIQAAIDVQNLITDITRYIDFYINSTGTNPTLTSTNTATTDDQSLNAVLVLEANKDFLAEESVSFMQATYPSYNFDADRCRRDIKAYVDAWKYDLTYTGNYKSLLAARYYRNAVLGSENEDMIYVRDTCGVRDCTLKGLTGSLNPPNVFDLYRRPTGGSFISLDPGWGPEDERVWIMERSPYIQGVTNIGNNCIGQKIDGSLHNGGNKSIVSNDFTQVLSDGVGCWVTNNARAELVSVFTYYCAIGYLAENGGIIRATNGNNSYGRYGAIADGVDETESPQAVTVNNRNNHAIVASVLAGEASDEIQILEFANAGERYTEADASIIGAGINAEVLFEEFRDNAIFEARLVDTSTVFSQVVGGGGYSVAQSNAQANPVPGADNVSICIASNDTNLEEDYIGKRLIIIGGTGTGQYGYITAYNTTTKVVNISKETNGQPGWDHVVPGTPLAALLDTTTRYRIEPRVIFADPGFSATQHDTGTTTAWASLAFGDITRTFNNVAGDPGTGDVIVDDGLQPLTARFNVTQNGRFYSVQLNTAGAGYSVGDEIIIEGADVGGVTPAHNIYIRVTATSEDSTNSITAFTYSGDAFTGRFVALAGDGSAGVWSDDGQEWTGFNMPSTGNWKCLASGLNRFVAIKTGTNQAASSLDGETWTARTMPAVRDWNSVVFGGGKFVAVAGNQNSAAYSTNGTTWTSTSMPTFGDSTFNQWVDVTYGKGKFVAVANSGNVAAYSADGINWTGTVMDVTADSSQKDWVSIAYGNNRFVTISSQGDVSYSFDGITWFAGTMPSQDGSTAHNWTQIRYAQGVFFAVGDTGSRTVGADETTGPTRFCATSPDGIHWTGREFPSNQVWNAVAFGSVYSQIDDSTVGLATPVWVASAVNSQSFARVRTGTRALGRVDIASGIITRIKLFDPGSGYVEPTDVTIVDPVRTTAARVETRIGDGVLAQPSWINRGLGYRSSSTSVTIAGDGYADIIPTGKFVTIDGLSFYPGPGAQISFSGNTTLYTVIATTELGDINQDGTLSARFRVAPDLKNRDKLEHGVQTTNQIRYSQVRMTGHDFLERRRRPGNSRS